jgi:hypothetical protein
MAKPQSAPTDLALSFRSQQHQANKSNFHRGRNITIRIESVLVCGSEERTRVTERGGGARYLPGLGAGGGSGRRRRERRELAAPHRPPLLIGEVAAAAAGRRHGAATRGYGKGAAGRTT